MDLALNNLQRLTCHKTNQPTYQLSSTLDKDLQLEHEIKVQPEPDIDGTE